MRFRRPSILALLLCLAYNAGSSAQTSAKDEPGSTNQPPKIVVQADGTVELPAQSVPMSKFLSPEAKAYLNQHLHDMQDPTKLEQDNGVPRFMVPYLERQKVLFPVVLDDQKSPVCMPTCTPPPAASLLPITTVC